MVSAGPEVPGASRHAQGGLRAGAQHERRHRTLLRRRLALLSGDLRYRLRSSFSSSPRGPDRLHPGLSRSSPAVARPRALTDGLQPQTSKPSSTTWHDASGPQSRPIRAGGCARMPLRPTAAARSRRWRPGCAARSAGRSATAGSARTQVTCRSTWQGAAPCRR